MLSDNDFEPYKKAVEELLETTQGITAIDIVDALFVSIDGESEKPREKPSSTYYNKLKKLGVSSEDFGLVDKIFGVLKGEACAEQVFFDKVVGVLALAGEIDGVSDEIYKVIYAYLVVVRLLKETKEYRAAIDTANQLLTLPRNVRKKWPSIVLLDYRDTLNDLKAILGSEVARFSSKELGGQGEGVFSVRKHKAKLKSGAVKEVVEKIVNLSSESSEVELGVFYDLYSKTNHGLPLPNVYLIKEREAVAHIYMECMSGYEKSKRNVEFYQDFARSAAKFNFSLGFHLPSRILPVNKKSTEVVGKLHAMTIIDAAQAASISEKVSSMFSHKSVIGFHLCPSHGDMHMRNTIYADQVYFIDYGGFVMAPAGHDLNFLLWLYPSRVAALTEESFLSAQARLLDCYIEEASLNWDFSSNSDIARNYLLLVSCLSWLSRSLKKDFVEKSCLSGSVATSALQSAEAEWVLSSEKAIDFLTSWGGDR